MAVHSKWVGNSLVFYDGSTTLFTIDGANGKVVVPSAPLKGSRFTVNLAPLAAAGIAVPFWTAPAPCKIIAAEESHVTVAGQAGTMQVTKLATGLPAGDAGEVALLATAFDLTSTAQTPVEKLGVTDGTEAFVKGDRLCTKVASGAATSYASGALTVVMEWM